MQYIELSKEVMDHETWSMEYGKLTANNTSDSQKREHRVRSAECQTMESVLGHRVPPDLVAHEADTVRV